METGFSAVSANERIQALDVLRGFALLGMLLVHFSDAAGPAQGASVWTLKAIELFVSERAYATFAMLFGAGFAVQLARARRRGVPFAWIWLRRSAVLAVFGLIAHGVFGYNVLLAYAVWGLALLLLERLPTRILLPMALLFAFNYPLYFVVRGAIEWATIGAAASDAHYAAWQQSASAAWQLLSTGRATELDLGGDPVSPQAHGLVLRAGLEFSARSVGTFPLRPSCLPPGPSHRSSSSCAHDRALDGNRPRRLGDDVAACSNLACRHTGPNRSWHCDLAALVLAHVHVGGSSIAPDRLPAALAAIAHTVRYDREGGPQQLLRADHHDQSAPLNVWVRPRIVSSLERAAWRAVALCRSFAAHRTMVSTLPIWTARVGLAVAHVRTSPATSAPRFETRRPPRAPRAQSSRPIPIGSS